MGNPLGQGLSFVLAPQVTTEMNLSTEQIQQLDNQWSKHLESEFAMAPTEELEKGFVTPGNYSKQNRFIGTNEETHVKLIFGDKNLRLFGENLFTEKVLIAGLGHLHTIETIRTLLRLGFMPEVWDISKGAITNAYKPVEEIIHGLNKSREIRQDFHAPQIVKHGELQTAIENGSIEGKIRAVIASRFFQHNPLEMLHAVGTLLQDPHTFLISMHLYDEDNKGTKGKTSKRYDAVTFREALQKGAQRKLTSKYRMYCPYYRQIYRQSVYE